jgi:hypothetical protein
MPTFAIVDMTSAALQSETEVDTADIIWDPNTMFASKAPVTAAATGTYALKVSASGQDAMNKGDYYRCGVHLVTP